MNNTAEVRRAVARKNRSGRMDVKFPREKEYAEYTTAAIIAATHAELKNTKDNLQPTDTASAA